MEVAEAQVDMEVSAPLKATLIVQVVDSTAVRPAVTLTKEVLLSIAHQSVSEVVDIDPALEAQVTAVEAQVIAVEVPAIAVEVPVTPVEDQVTPVEVQATAVEVQATAVEAPATAVEDQDPTVVDHQVTLIQTNLMP